ncbi:MAG: septal ring lytic transglycosylase RlpA family protein [Pseudomonadota bacterium]
MTPRHTHRDQHRNLVPRAAGAAALAALSLPSGSAFAAQPADDGARDEETPAVASPDAAPVSSLAAAFATLGAPTPVSSPAPGAVDLTAFDPPRGPRVVRSLGTKVASYYGKRFHGRRTANGERFDMNAMTAAHKTLPFGTRVRVTNPANGRAVTVRINDRGPFIAGRAIDLSRAAAQRLGMIQRGHARVRLDIVAP